MALQTAGVPGRTMCMGGCNRFDRWLGTIWMRALSSLLWLTIWLTEQRCRVDCTGSKRNEYVREVQSYLCSLDLWSRKEDGSLWEYLYFEFPHWRNWLNKRAINIADTHGGDKLAWYSVDNWSLAEHGVGTRVSTSVCGWWEWSDRKEEVQR